MLRNKRNHNGTLNHSNLGRWADALQPVICNFSWHLFAIISKIPEADLCHSAPTRCPWFSIKFFRAICLANIANLQIVLSIFTAISFSLNSLKCAVSTSFRTKKFGNGQPTIASQSSLTVNTKGSQERRHSISNESICFFGRNQCLYYSLKLTRIDLLPKWHASEMAPIQ